MSRYMLETASSSHLVAALHGRRARWLNSGAGGVDILASGPDASAAVPVRHVHGERDFGVGYGNSSGYATGRHYVSEWLPQQFRCH